jgi:hypothetical protein
MLDMTREDRHLDYARHDMTGGHDMTREGKMTREHDMTGISPKISLYLPPQTRIDMNFEGIIAGLATFLIIGLFHPIVIKAEYHFGKECWWVFLFAGLGFAALSLFIDSIVWSTITGVTAFSCFWSIKELIDQEKRVSKGWFPANPKRKKS